MAERDLDDEPELDEDLEDLEDLEDDDGFPEDYDPADWHGREIAARGFTRATSIW